MTLNKELKCQSFQDVKYHVDTTYSYLGAIQKLLCNTNTSNRNNTILILKEHLNKYIKLQTEKCMFFSSNNALKFFFHF